MISKYLTRKQRVEKLRYLF